MNPLHEIIRRMQLRLLGRRTLQHITQGGTTHYSGIEIKHTCQREERDGIVKTYRLIADDWSTSVEVYVVDNDICDVQIVRRHPDTADTTAAIHHWLTWAV